eukprot:scaffold66713_cov57-Phaeocystis_antarctica.AAC.1
MVRLVRVRRARTAVRGVPTIQSAVFTIYKVICKNLYKKNVITTRVYEYGTRRRHHGVLCVRLRRPTLLCLVPSARPPSLGRRCSRCTATLGVQLPLDGSERLLAQARGEALGEPFHPARARLLPRGGRGRLRVLLARSCTSARLLMY